MSGTRSTTRCASSAGMTQSSRYGLAARGRGVSRDARQKTRDLREKTRSQDTVFPARITVRRMMPASENAGKRDDMRRIHLLYGVGKSVARERGKEACRCELGRVHAVPMGQFAQLPLKCEKGGSSMALVRLPASSVRALRPAVGLEGCGLAPRTSRRSSA